MSSSQWRLPLGIDELMPKEAKSFEAIRRQIIDHMTGHGYDLVVPAMVDYVENLVPQLGSELDLQTFKVVDQLDGRTLGVRADMTPQVSRMVAQHCQGSAVFRCCYAGSVLRTRPDGLAGSQRSPFQVGAELFAPESIEADLEIIELMVQTLGVSGVESLYVDIGHVGIYSSLIRALELNPKQEAQLFEVLQRKSVPDAKLLLTELGIKDQHADDLMALIELNGGVEAIETAQSMIDPQCVDAHHALEHLKLLADRLTELMPNLSLHVDLAELRGYRYHNGLVFAAYAGQRTQEIARGGRYTGHGRSGRDAIGFSFDLRHLLDWAESAQQYGGTVEVPFEAPATSIAALKQRGFTVLRPQQSQKSTHRLSCIDDQWCLEELS